MSGYSSPAEGELERFRAAIARVLGFAFDEHKLAFLSEVLQRRVEGNRVGVDAYLLALEQGASRAEVRALARELTVGETYFFRNSDQFRAFASVAFSSTAQRLSVLSAGCSSGEEAYSLAMLAREQAPPGLEVSIHAVDVNPAVLERAARGRYSTWALRETSDERKQRWFRPDGRDLLLDPSIVSAVQFSEVNLIHDEASLWRPGAYDVIFCRNVLMYFAPELAREVLVRVARSLRPGGYLFLGHAETLRGLSSDFHLLHTHETFYYQRKPALGVSGEPHREPPPAAEPWLGAIPWIDAVQRSHERIRDLAEHPIVGVQPVGASTIATHILSAQSDSIPPRPNTNRALELLQKERYREALQLVPEDSRADADAQLLRASLLIHTGELSEAERVCDALLALNELSAGAHYLLALCREAAGDRGGAISHDQVACYLEPGFVMPSLHLGLLARRTGDRAQARRELGRALSLLPAEDTSRLLLFGGGFSREALLSLCRAELAALEPKT